MPHVGRGMVAVREAEPTAGRARASAWAGNPDATVTRGDRTGSDGHGRTPSFRACAATQPQIPGAPTPAPPVDGRPAPRAGRTLSRGFNRAGSLSMSEHPSQHDDCKLMVWGIGGEYESKEALSRIFGQFGTVHDAAVRHRIDDDGQNTSWALLTMAAASEAEAILEAAAELAPFTVALFQVKQAEDSVGAMANNKELAHNWKMDSEGPLSLRREDLRSREFSKHGATQTVVQPDDATHMSTLRDVHVGGYFSSCFFTASGSLFGTGGDDRQITVHNMRTGQKTVLLERTVAITAAAVSFDGTMMVVGDDSGQLGVYVQSDGVDSPRRDEEEQNSGEEDSSDAVLPVHGQIGRCDSVLRVDITSRAKLKMELKPKQGTGLQLAWEPVHLHSAITSAAFSLDGRLVVSMCEDGRIEVRDARTGLDPSGDDQGDSKPTEMSCQMLDFHGYSRHGSRSLAFSSECLAVCGGGLHDKQVRLWDCKTLEVKRTIDFPASVTSIALRSDGQALAVGFDSGSVQLVRLMMAKYVAAKSSTIRQTSDINSLKVGRLEAGEVVQAVKARPGSDGITRIFIGDGWVSDKRADGLAVLEKVSNGAEFLHRRESRVSWKTCRRVQRSAVSADQKVHMQMIGLPDAGQQVQSLAYSHTGDLLAVGKHSGTFLLYDTNSAACIASYKHGESRGMAVAFSPASDLLALGGGHFQSAVLHRLQPPALLRRFKQASGKHARTVFEGLHKNITCATVSVDYAAICSGNHVRLINRDNEDDRVLIKPSVPVRAAEEPIALRNGKMCQVAVVLAAQSVVVYSHLGEVVLELPGHGQQPWDGDCRGVAWSFDGQWLYAWGNFGVRVHDANYGTYKYHFDDHKAVTRDCEIDPTNTYIVTAGTSRCVLVRDMHSEKTIHTFIEDGITGPCTFDHTGERLAYFDRGRGSGSGKIVLRNVKSGEVLREYTGVKARSQIKFSPGNSDYLLCVDFSRQVTVLNTKTGLSDRPLWGGLLRSMALPAGTLTPFAVGWAPATDLHFEEHSTIWIGQLPLTVVNDPGLLEKAVGAFGTSTSVSVRQKSGDRKSWALCSFSDVAVAQAAVHAGTVQLPGEDGTEVACPIRKSTTSEHLNAEPGGGLANVALHHGNRALVLYAAIDTDLCMVDVNQFQLTAEDGTFTAEQLIALTENQPEQVGLVSRRFPNSVNRRHIGKSNGYLETGDTVLHYCARNSKADEMIAWLHGKADYEPVANAKGNTALHDAIKTHNRKIIRQLYSQLTENLNEISGPLLTASLKLLALETPELVLECLQHIERCALQTHHQFRTLTHRPEVLGVSTLSTSAPEHQGLNSTSHKFPSQRQLGMHLTKPDWSLTRIVTTAAAGTQQVDSGQEFWSSLLPSKELSAKEILVASKVLPLADFIGDPESSPYHTIVERCDANVFESKLMQLATQFKWERNVKRRIHLQMLSYAAAMMLASFAMAASAISGPRVQYQVMYLEDYQTQIPLRSIDVMVIVMVIVELVSLWNESMQLMREGYAKYFSVWNVLDAGGSILLLFGAAGHFTMLNTWLKADSAMLEFVRLGITGEHIVRNAGSIGVLVKWIGFLDYLRSWNKTTGPIIRMIVVILMDMIPFLMILGLVFCGMVMFLVINMPWSDSHRYAPGPGNSGVLWPVIGLVHLVIFGEADDNAYSQSFLGTWVTLFFAFFVMVLMMNLLIAIMGDSYEKVKEGETVEGIKERAKTVVDMELRYPLMHDYPKYMCICEGAEDDTDLPKPWAGIGGRVISETIKVVSRVSALDEDMKSGLEDVNTRMETVQARLATTAYLLGELDVKMSDLARRPGEGGESGMVHQLERLARLHSAGELDDAEYSSAKSKLLKE